MYRRILCLAIFALAGVHASKLSAQAPGYTPYGAHRGWVRTVYGPYRIRHTARWGNGITPVGATVLNNVITTAGMVVTDPNFVKLFGSQQQDSGFGSSDQTDQLVNILKQSNQTMETFKAKFGTGAFEGHASPRGASNLQERTTAYLNDAEKLTEAYREIVRINDVIREGNALVQAHADAGNTDTRDKIKAVNDAVLVLKQSLQQKIQ